MKLADILPHFEDFIREAEQAFTYEKIFDLTGATKALEEMYITPKDLTREYRNLLYNGIKKFISNPLYKDLRLNNEDDLAFLNKSDDFKSYLQGIFKKIKDKLVAKEVKLPDYFKQYDSKSEIKLEKIMSDLKIDKISLLFILDDMKKNKKIYDYNGREVTLK